MVGQPDNIMPSDHTSAGTSGSGSRIDAGSNFQRMRWRGGVATSAVLAISDCCLRLHTGSAWRLVWLQYPPGCGLG